MSCRYCEEKMITLCPFNVHLSVNGLISLGIMGILVLVGFVGFSHVGGCIERERAIVNSMDTEWETVYRIIDEMPCCDKGSGADRFEVLKDLCELNAENHHIDMPALTPEQQELFLSMFGNAKGRAAILVSRMTMKARQNGPHVPGE